MAATVGQVLELLERLAPPELAEPWDNIGLLAGSRSGEVDCVLCALDFNQRVLDEAVAKGAQLIVTHHPILFGGRKNLCMDDPEGLLLCNLVRSGISLIAMHTNYDSVHPGVNDALAQALGLENVEPLAQGMCIGSVCETSLREFRKSVEEALGGVARAYGPADASVRRVAVMGGSAGDYAHIAIAAGADVYVTGEMGYHKGLDAVDRGMCVLEAGHAATENPAILALVGGLQNDPDMIQYKIRVLRSAEGLFL